MLRISPHSEMLASVTAAARDRRLIRHPIPSHQRVAAGSPGIAISAIAGLPSLGIQGSSLPVLSMAVIAGAGADARLQLDDFLEQLPVSALM
jgi:hypothetical protein